MTNDSTLGFDGGLTCSLQCSDLDASLSWYQDVLGFEVQYKLDEMAWAEMVSPVKRVNLGLGQVEEVQTKGGATLTWGVQDIEAARAKLEAQDVRFDGETRTIPGMVSLATFFDPDGNQHMLYQDLQTEGE
ncbi:MAG: VOC family protein [Planctomycetota bacterium]|nr:VOC family protein [Planctomycetota bacterium]